MFPLTDTRSMFNADVAAYRPRHLGAGPFAWVRYNTASKGTPRDQPSFHAFCCGLAVWR
jgi:hypothetical protein